MPASSAAAAAFLDHTFLNSAWAGLGDAGGLQPSAAAGNVYIRLHSADPLAAGTGSTDELSYTGYAPVAVPRTSAGWERTANVMANKALVQFGKNTGGSSQTAKFYSVCEGSGAGADIISRSQLAADLVVSPNVQPQFEAGDITVTVPVA